MHRILPLLSWLNSIPPQPRLVWSANSEKRGSRCSILMCSPHLPNCPCGYCKESLSLITACSKKEGVGRPGYAKMIPELSHSRRHVNCRLKHPRCSRAGRDLAGKEYVVGRNTALRTPQEKSHDDFEAQVTSVAMFHFTETCSS
jgi:hypothetical protein